MKKRNQIVEFLNTYLGSFIAGCIFMAIIIWSCVLLFVFTRYNDDMNDARHEGYMECFEKYMEEGK